MESAIPPHLQVARTRHRRVPDDYQPPYPAFVARHRPAVERVVMAYFGLQYRGEAPPARDAALASLETISAAKNGPKHWDRAAYRDEADYDNVVSVAYWDDQRTFEAWFPAARDGWTGEQQNHAGLGTFVEVLSPSVSDYETLFSSLGRPEGVAVLADSLSGDIMEHAYWGGMRDRIPQSQTSEMAPGGTPGLVRDGERSRVKPPTTFVSSARGRIGATPTRPSARCISTMSSRCCARAWIFCATTAARSAASPIAT
jgi:aldoxime dehydratase